LTVQVRGLDELKRELARLSGPTAGRLARNAAMAGARVAARQAKLRGPVQDRRVAGVDQGDARSELAHPNGAEGGPRGFEAVLQPVPRARRRALVSEVLMRKPGTERAICAGS
jgi:hypothetical protein